MLELTHGFSGTVYIADGSEYAPKGADIIKYEKSTDNLEYARQFVKLKIAKLLMPDNFPKVVGCRLQKVDNLSHKVIYNHVLFTKHIVTPTEHLTFCKDIGKGVNGLKKSYCECGDCSNHRVFHSEHLEEMLKTTVDAGFLGVAVPFNDPTDWCVDNKGNIVFFEVNDIDVDTVMGNLNYKDPFKKSNLEKLCIAYSKFK